MFKNPQLQTKVKAKVFKKGVYSILNYWRINFKVIKKVAIKGENG